MAKGLGGVAAGLSQNLADVLAATRDYASLAVPIEFPASPQSRPLGGLGSSTLTAIGAVGTETSLVWAYVRALRHPQVYLPLTFAQVWEIGLGSLALVLLVAMISGAVTSEQTGYQYSSTLPLWIVGSVITASVIPVDAGVLVRDLHARPGRYIHVSIF